MIPPDAAKRIQRFHPGIADPSLLLFFSLFDSVMFTNE